MLLTSHYMADVQALCRRVVVIDDGQMLYDGGLRELSTRYAPHQTITVRSARRDRPSSRLRRGGRGRRRAGHAAGAQGRSAAIAGRLLADHQVTDLTIEDPPIEDVIEQVFADRAGGGQPGDDGDRATAGCRGCPASTRW